MLQHRGLRAELVGDLVVVADWFPLQRMARGRPVAVLVVSLQNRNKAHCIRSRDREGLGGGWGSAFTTTLNSDDGRVTHIGRSAFSRAVFAEEISAPFCFDESSLVRNSIFSENKISGIFAMLPDVWGSHFFH